MLYSDNFSNGNYRDNVVHYISNSYIIQYKRTYSDNSFFGYNINYDFNSDSLLLKETRKNMSEAHKGEKHHKSKWWKITFVDGTEIVICGMNGWAKENAYSYSCVYRVYTGKYKKHKDIIKVEVITKKDT